MLSFFENGNCNGCREAALCVLSSAKAPVPLFSSKYRPQDGSLMQISVCDFIDKLAVGNWKKVFGKILTVLFDLV